MSLGMADERFQTHYWKRGSFEDGLDIDWDKLDSVDVHYSGPEESIAEGEEVAEDISGEECRRLLEEVDPEAYDEFSNYTVLCDTGGEILTVHVYSEERYGPFNVLRSDRESLFIQNIEYEEE